MTQKNKKEDSDNQVESVQISAKQFVKKLKEELKGEKVLGSVYVAFVSIVPMVDTEENYRKIWKTTFKRD